MITLAGLRDPAQRPGGPDTRHDFVCECGERLKVFGGGRHRIYFPEANAALDDPIMDAQCPACSRNLPGKQ